MLNSGMGKHGWRVALLTCVLLRVALEYQPGGGVKLPGASIWTPGQFMLFPGLLDVREKNP